MAKNDNIIDFTTDIADAIREKTGETGLINPQDFSTVIRGISGAENLDAELNEQEALLAKLEEDVNELSDKPTDMLQMWVDSVGTCVQIFSNYQGEKIDFIKNLDTSQITNFTSMFAGSTKLKEIPVFDSSNATNFNSTFMNCSAVKTMPMLKTSKVVIFQRTFYLCTALEEVPQWDFSSASNCQEMFSSCRELKSYSQTFIPSIVEKMFNGCSAIETIEILDLRNTTTLSSLVYGCKNLKNLTLRNIRGTIAIGAGTSYGTLLTLDSILNTIKELWDLTGSTAQTLTMSTASKELIANTCVKLVDITDEMRAEDEFIDYKLPFIVCESTDDGAMTIQEYITSKNWNLS